MLSSKYNPSIASNNKVKKGIRRQSSLKKNGDKDLFDEIDNPKDNRRSTMKAKRTLRNTVVTSNEFGDGTARKQNMDEPVGACCNNNQCSIF